MSNVLVHQTHGIADFRLVVLFGDRHLLYRGVDFKLNLRERKVVVVIVITGVT